MSRKPTAPATRSARSVSTDARSGRDLCEPTLTCESHYFSLYKAPAGDPKPQAGAMVERFEACLKGLFDAVPALPTTIEQAQAEQTQIHGHGFEIHLAGLKSSEQQRLFHQ